MIFSLLASAMIASALPDVDLIKQDDARNMFESSCLTALTHTSGLDKLQENYKLVFENNIKAQEIVSLTGVGWDLGKLLDANLDVRSDQEDLCRRYSLKVTTNTKALDDVLLYGSSAKSSPYSSTASTNPRYAQSIACNTAFKSTSQDPTAIALHIADQIRLKDPVAFHNLVFGAERGMYIKKSKGMQDGCN